MPKKKKPQSSTSKEQCCVCCQPIAKGKDESLFCGGDCQQWLHCYCAGVSKQVFSGLAEEGSAFFCFACCLKRHRREIDALKDTVEHLKCELIDLKSSSPATPQAAPSLSPVPTAPATVLQSLATMIYCQLSSCQRPRAEIQYRSLRHGRVSKRYSKIQSP